MERELNFPPMQLNMLTVLGERNSKYAESLIVVVQHWQLFRKDIGVRVVTRRESMVSSGRSVDL